MVKAAVLRGLSPRRPPVVFSAMERRLAANLKRSLSELHTLQSRALSSRLQDALKHVPAYQPLGRSKALQREIIDAPRLALTRIPPTTRAALGADLEAYRHRLTPRAVLRETCTSGSTGEPVRAEWDVPTMLWEEAYILRQWRRFGYERGDAVLRIRRDGPAPGGEKVVDRDLASGEFRVAASGIDDATTEVVLKALTTHKVRVLRGFPSSLLELTRRALALGGAESMKGSPVRVLQTSSEVLEPEVWDYLRESWGSPVMDHYGLSERALLIQSCPQRRYHLMQDYAVGEVLDGRWHGTRLHGRGTVLLRYDTGDGAGEGDDEAVAASRDGSPGCECGWPFPVVSAVDGRRDEVILTPDGRRIGHLRAAAKVPGALRIRFEQTAPDSVLARVILRPDADGPAVLDELRRRMAAQLASPEMKIEIRSQESFPGDKSQAAP